MNLEGRTRISLRAPVFPPPESQLRNFVWAEADSSTPSSGSPAEMVEHWSSLQDPLRLDLKKQTQKLLDRIPADSPYFAAVQNASSRQALLNALSALLHVPQFTMLVATLFRPLLLDLCARWLYQEADRLEKFEALCLLLEIYQELYACVRPALVRNLRDSN